MSKCHTPSVNSNSLHNYTHIVKAIWLRSAHCLILCETKWDFLRYTVAQQAFEIYQWFFAYQVWHHIIWDTCYISISGMPSYSVLLRMLKIINIRYHDIRSARRRGLNEVSPGRKPNFYFITMIFHNAGPFDNILAHSEILPYDPYVGVNAGWMLIPK